MNNKKLGIILIVIVLLLAGTFWYVRAEFVKAQLDRIIDDSDGGCIHEGDTCPFQEINKLNIPTLLISVLLLILLSFGIYLMYKKEKKEIKKSYSKILKTLEKDEKDIFKEILEEKGTVFQSELVEKTGLSKVKITRVLDRLEGKGLIERKRRGMTNIVILRH